jgi:hypothetical protein
MSNKRLTWLEALTPKKSLESDDDIDQLTEWIDDLPIYWLSEWLE